MSVVHIRDLSYTYGGTQPITALQNIELEIGDNEFVSLIGPSGCGKSTLLRLVADLLAPVRGSVQIDGAPAATARRQRTIGFVFQEPALMPWRTSAANVRLPLEVMRATRRRGSVVSDLLRLVGLQDFGDKRPDQLSGGMRQRVSIARSLTYDPHVLLMDEPFGALDQITRDEMNEELLTVWEQKRSTVLFVTHSIAEAIYLSDRVVVLSARPGRIVDVVPVPLERPRTGTMKRCREFIETESRVLAGLEGRVMADG
ncbi:MAG: ABC transporter ATP-binding protein [Chloroflexota bacterium]